MSTENEEIVPDSDPCPNDDVRDSPNATDDEATPSQYKKTRRDDDDDEEKAKESDSEALMDYEAGLCEVLHCRQSPDATGEGGSDGILSSGDRNSFFSYFYTFSYF
jgi:hypothetical protein